MKKTVAEELDQIVTSMSKTTRLKSWNEYVAAMNVPSDLFPALATSRAELLALAQPRAMKAEEVAKLYEMIGVLIETNLELRRHAEEVAHQVRTWTDSFKALRSVGYRIEDFANFRTSRAKED